MRDIVGHFFARGEHSDIGIEMRGDCIVIAGGKMHVAGDTVALAPYYHATLQWILRPTSP